MRVGVRVGVGKKFECSTFCRCSKEDTTLLKVRNVHRRGRRFKPNLDGVRSGIHGMGAGVLVNLKTN